MDMRVDRDTEYLVVGVLQAQMCHFRSNTRKRNQILVIVWNFSPMFLMNDLSSFLDILSLLVVESNLRNPGVEI